MNENSRRIRVMVVDDHDMLREGLYAFMRSYDDLELVGDASSGFEAVQKCLEVNPDVILMDLAMPEMDGATAIQLIHQNQPEIRIIVLSCFCDEHRVKNALQNGATSYLLKNVSAARLADAIRTSAQGKPVLAPEAAQILIHEATSPPDQFPKLTPRETDVLRLMVRGYSNLKISETLCISIFTVKNHVCRILTKLEVGSRTEAVSTALNNNHIIGN